MTIVQSQKVTKEVPLYDIASKTVKLSNVKFAMFVLYAQFLKVTKQIFEKYLSPFGFLHFLKEDPNLSWITC